MEEKILVALDDSEDSWNAFDYAVLEAKGKGLNRITAVHSEVGGRSRGAKEYRTGREILEEAESLGAEEDVEVETKLLMRGLDPDDDIVRFAEENDYNHIIVGHRGRSGVNRLFPGSVAAGVVEKAHCVVTVVRAAPFIRKVGSRIDSREIENLLEEHEGVAKSAVIGVSDKKEGTKLIAFILPTEGYEPTEEMIKEFMEQFVEKGKIEWYEVPDEVKVLEKMPQTGAGTINRETLKEKYT